MGTTFTMMNHRDQMEARRRAAERRQREDEAPRLHEEAPRLDSLRLEIEDGDSKYLWRIVVERAPSLFEVGCGERACKDGGHNLTLDVMRALRQQKTEFSGEHSCNGQVRTGECARLLRYHAVATYKDT